MRFFSIVLIILTLTTTALGQENTFQISTKSHMKRIFAAHLKPLQLWLEDLNESDYDLICFGETHNDYYRDLEKSKILPYLNINNLIIEANSAGIRPLLENFNSGDASSVKVTGAPFYEVLTSYFHRNPQSSVYGVEPSTEQKAQTTFANIEALTSDLESVPSRDSFIATNTDILLSAKKKRNFAIYGSSHCSYFESGLGFDTPFMRFLLKKYGTSKKIINVHTLEPSEEHLLKIYLKGFDLLKEGEDLVLVNSRAIDPALYNYRMELFRLLQSYDVIYFPSN